MAYRYSCKLFFWPQSTIICVKSWLLWKPVDISTNFFFYWSQLWFTIRTIKEHFAVHLWNFSLGLNISCHIMQTVNEARNGFQKCSISFIKIENWGFTSVEWKFTDSFKGGLISEGILTLVPFPKKVPNFYPEQKIWISCLLTPPIAEILCFKNGRVIVVCGFLMK